MIQPPELQGTLGVSIPDDIIVDTSGLWEILSASYLGDLKKVQALFFQTPALLYAQYNYTPPIHFAVRERHITLVSFLLEKGAYDPSYKIYPFQESLVTIALDRGYIQIAELLLKYTEKPEQQMFGGDNGEIHYNRTPLENEFEKAVDEGDLTATRAILEKYPLLAKNNSFFWSEGILLMPVKNGRYELIDLLISYGATVPSLLKWAQYYYFETEDYAAYIMKKGMSPNTMSWHKVTLLHDMAQKGQINKAALLLSYGAELNAIDEEYQSTPLGLAVKWQHTAMVEFLLSRGANPSLAGAAWATPLAWAKKKENEEIIALIEKALK